MDHLKRVGKKGIGVVSDAPGDRKRRQRWSEREGQRARSNSLINITDKKLKPFRDGMPLGR